MEETKKLNILIVTQYFWPESFLINQLSAELLEYGHQVTVFTGMPNYPSGKLFPGYTFSQPKYELYKENIQIFRTPIFPRGKGGALRLVLNYLSFVFFGSINILKLRKKNFDLIFVFQPSPITTAIPALLLKKITHAKLYLWVQDLWPDNAISTSGIKNKVVIKSLEVVTNYIYRKTDYILVQSKGFIQKIAARSKENEIRYLPNWGGQEHQPIFDKQAMRKELNLPKGFLILYAGNHGVAQDLSTIIKAADKLKNINYFHIIFVGDGREKNKLIELSKTFKLNNLIFLEAVTSDEITKYYGAADALYASLKNDELLNATIPSKVQSYLTTGKPLLVSLSGEGEKIINEAGCGLVSKPGDSGQLAKNIQTMLNMSQNNLHSMGQKGLKYYNENFSKAIIIDRLCNWFKEDTS